jgi:hypothetical protein
VLSGLVKKNKMGHLGGATLGGAMMYGGSMLIDHINLKRENPSELVKEHKKEMAILLTGIGIVGGFSITLMCYGEARGVKKQQLLIIKQYEKEIEDVWSIENRLTDEEKEAETRVLMRLLKQAIEKYKAM